MKLQTDLDKKDLDILQALQERGRASLGSIAETVGLSSPATADRIRKLEERGVIRRFTAVLGTEALALDIAAIIQVRVDTSTHYPEFLAEVAGCTEVLECHAITGEASHLLKIRTRNTASLESLLAEIQRWPGVVGTRTNLILSTHKEETALPLDHARSVIDPVATTSEGVIKGDRKPTRRKKSRT